MRTRAATACHGADEIASMPPSFLRTGSNGHSVVLRTLVRNDDDISLALDCGECQRMFQAAGAAASSGRHGDAGASAARSRPQRQPGDAAGADPGMQRRSFRESSRYRGLSGMPQHPAK